MAASRFVGAKEFQIRSEVLLQDVTDTGEPCYITQDGKAKAVLIDINRYNALMDLMEEAESLKAHEVGEETRQLASVRGILKRSTTRVIRRR